MLGFALLDGSVAGIEIAKPELVTGRDRLMEK